MANEGLYERQKLIGAIYRNELAAGLAQARVRHREDPLRTAVSRSPGSPARRSGSSRPAARRSRRRWPSADSATSADNPRHAERAALMTRATKREVDRDELRRVWHRQAVDLGLDVGNVHGLNRARAPPSGGRNQMARGITATRGTAGPRRRTSGCGLAQLPAEVRRLTYRRSGKGGGRDAVKHDGARRRRAAGLADPFTGPPRRYPRRSRGRWRTCRSARPCSARADSAGRGPELRARHVSTVEAVEREVAGLEKAGHAAHAVNLPGASGLARDRPHGGARARDHRPDARGRGAREGARCGAGAVQEQLSRGSAHGRPEARRCS